MRRAWPWAAALVLWTLLLFAWTVDLRDPSSGQLDDSPHLWLSAHSLAVTRAWYQRGALACRLAMVSDPSPEAPGTERAYVSYPSGFLLPLHGVVRLLGRPPDLALVQRVNLGLHLGLALLLGLGTLALLLDLGVPADGASLMAAGLAATILLLPGPLFWMHATYFADQVVLLPLVLASLLEAQRAAHGPSPWNQRAMALTMFWGAATEWIFLPVAAVLLVRRRLSGEPRPWRQVFLPAALPALGHLALVVWLGQTRDLLHRGLARSGLETVGSDEAFGLGTALGHLVDQYGALALGAGCLVLIWLVRARCRAPEDRSLAALGALVWVPLGASLLHLALLHQHAAEHAFSALKLAPVLATLLLVCPPLLAASPAPGAPPSRREVHFPTLALTMLLGGAWVLTMTPGYAEFLEEDPLAGAAQAGWIGQQFPDEALVASPDLSIPHFPPMLFALSGLPVRRTPTVQSLQRLTRAMGRARVDLLVRLTPSDNWTHLLEGLTPSRGPGLKVYRDVDPFRWLDLTATPRPAPELGRVDQAPIEVTSAAPLSARVTLPDDQRPTWLGLWVQGHLGELRPFLAPAGVAETISLSLPVTRLGTHQDYLVVRTLGAGHGGQLVALSLHHATPARLLPGSPEVLVRGERRTPLSARWSGRRYPLFRFQDRGRLSGHVQDRSQLPAPTEVHVFRGERWLGSVTPRPRTGRGRRARHPFSLELELQAWQGEGPLRVVLADLDHACELLAEAPGGAGG